MLAEHPPTIHFRGVVLGPSGFAAEGREWLAALELAGCNPSLEGASLGPHSGELNARDRALIERCAARPRAADAIVFHHLLAPHFVADERAPFQIVTSPFETDSLPAGWAAHLGTADMIVARTPYNRAAFVRGGLSPSRIVVIPPPFDATPFEPRRTRDPDRGHRPFRWLSVFDWSLRKGHDVLLAAFVEAFAQGEAELLIKTMPPTAGRDPRVEVADTLRQLGDPRRQPKVEVLAANLPSCAPLYAAADGFVLASRGEGWGRPVHEAMLCELPVVVTAATSLRALVPDASVGYPVAATRVPVSAAAVRETPSFAGQAWYEPDPQQLVRCMREVVADPESAKWRGVRARAHVLELCDPSRVIELLLTALRSAPENAARR